MKVPVAIVGAGPAGCAASLFLAKRGIASAIIERDRFPRFHIGESLTGECGNCLRTLGLGEQMANGDYPVKHGVTVFGPDGKNSFWVPVMGRDENGQFPATTWQVRRSTFDQILLDKCESSGATFVQASAHEPLRAEDGAVTGVRVRDQHGKLFDIESEVLLDASGLSTFLSNAGVASAKDRGTYDKQLAIFSHVTGAERDQGDRHDSTIIYYRERHHWAWFIPIDSQTVSVGVVTPSDYFTARRESKRDFLLREFRELNVKLAERVADATLVEDVRAISNYSYHVRNYTGKGFVCVGDSHRFIDPVFSYGLYFAVKEAEKAADAVERYLAGENRDATNPFAAHQDLCEAAQDNIEALIDAFWNEPYAFAIFAHHRYREDFIDLFAGRVYDGIVSPGLAAIHGINEIGRRRMTAAAN